MTYFNGRSAEVRSAVSVDARFIAEALSIDTDHVTPVDQLRNAYETFKHDCNLRERAKGSWNTVIEMLKNIGRVEHNREFEAVELVGRYASG